MNICSEYLGLHNSRCAKTSSWKHTHTHSHPRTRTISTHLQHGLHGDSGDNGGADLLPVAGHLAHGEEHWSGEREGRDPHGADKLLSAAPGHDALRFERVADGHVALHAQAGDVERGGVGAAVPQEVVAPAHGVPEHPRVVEPDEIVELDGHGEDEDEQVRHGQAGQVVVHGALEVLQALFGQQGVQGDGVPQGADGEQSHVEDGDYHLGVDVGVHLQVFFLGSGSARVVPDGRQRLVPKQPLRQRAKAGQVALRERKV